MVHFGGVYLRCSWDQSVTVSDPQLAPTSSLLAHWEYQWRRGGLVVSALDFRSRGWWFEPGHCRRVVSLNKKPYSALSLFTQVYKWVPAIIMLGGNLAMD